MYPVGMATWDDVRMLALALPETTEGSDTSGLAKWMVRGKYFAWERPLRKRDIEELGDAVPTGPILGLRTADLDDKRGLIGSNPQAFLTTSHFAEYPAVLVLLDEVEPDQLEEVITDAWLCRAPKRLAAEFLSPGAGG